MGMAKAVEMRALEMDEEAKRFAVMKDVLKKV